MDKCSISKATLGRLPSYLEFLRNLPPDKVPYISATAIAKHFGLGEVQVRKDLAAVSGAEKPKLGIITVGEGSAQAVCDQMVKSGITAIWNFAPYKLNVPTGILLQNENLALSLAHLNNQLCKFN